MDAYADAYQVLLVFKWSVLFSVPGIYWTKAFSGPFKILSSNLTLHLVALFMSGTAQQHNWGSAAKNGKFCVVLSTR